MNGTKLIIHTQLGVDMKFWSKWQALGDINTKCVECGALTADNWLFECTDPIGWVCGTCVGLDHD